MVFRANSPVSITSRDGPASWLALRSGLHRPDAAYICHLRAWLYRNPEEQAKMGTAMPAWASPSSHHPSRRDLGEGRYVGMGWLGAMICLIGYG